MGSWCLGAKKTVWPEGLGARDSRWMSEAPGLIQVLSTQGRGVCTWLRASLPKSHLMRRLASSDVFPIWQPKDQGRQVASSEGAWVSCLLDQGSGVGGEPF